MFCKAIVDFRAKSVPSAFEKLKVRNKKKSFIFQAESFSGKDMFCSMIIGYGTMSLSIAFEKFKVSHIQYIFMKAF